MANKGGLSRERRSQIGGVVYFARRLGLPWKVLEARFGRERTQLWRYAQGFAALMQQKTPVMQHLGAGRSPADAPMLGALVTQTPPEPDSMSGLFGGNAPAPQVVSTPTPTLSDPAVTAAARQEQLSAARARGRGATVLTGGEGVPGTAPTMQKTLLGS